MNHSTNLNDSQRLVVVMNVMTVMTVMTPVLLTLETSEMKPDTDMLNSGKNKFAKRGQMGRALSEKELRLGGGLSYEPEGDEEPSVEKFAGDIDDFLIVDSYGTKDERYGKKPLPYTLGVFFIDRYSQL